MDGPPRYFRYCCWHKRVQGCGSSNSWPVILFRFLSLVREKATEKIGYKVLQFIFFFGRMPQLSFIITETRNCLFLFTKYKFVLYCIIYCTSFLSFQFPWIIWSFENKKWRSCYRWTTTGLHYWTGGPFMEQYLLLQIASTVQSFPSAI